MTRLLFTYGTLMKGHQRSASIERQGLRLVGLAKIRGDLWSVHDSFPAFVTGPGEVRGEVWEAPTDAILRGALHVTDTIEGYRPDRPASSMYVREEHPLLDDPAGRTVFAYRWNLGMSGLRLIASGDWHEYVSALHGVEAGLW